MATWKLGFVVARAGSFGLWERISGNNFLATAFAFTGV